LLGATEMASFSGTNVKRDFVELPSQMLEEWTWDRDMLAKISSHYITGKSLPQEIISTILKLKHFDAGQFVKRQIALSKISLELFAPGRIKDVDTIAQKIFSKLTHIYQSTENHFVASFGHLTGYGAKYYSYLWSRVFALDLFETIKQHGLLNSEIGHRYRNEVIGKGGSQDPEILLKNFLGREPKSDAFFKELRLT
ncbi:MAG TPA: M3 family metallopeptidase, partial [Candidatus Babeliaceae bacterium]|nr:M3 family metallopeptidase [Candidatus Babeliaceae bacterium]